MSMLPPCRICGEKASGFHYGVNTCEACKAFFRRSLNKYETYVCNNNKSCELPPGRRNFCAFCRFKRCVVMGMCRNAIKTGRYTHEKKANDIKELKGMKEWSAPAEDQVQVELQERLEVLQKEQQLLAVTPNVMKPAKPAKERRKRKVESKQERINGDTEPMICENKEDLRDNFQHLTAGLYTAMSSVCSNESAISDIPSVANSIDAINSPLLYSPPSITYTGEPYYNSTRYAAAADCIESVGHHSGNFLVASTSSEIIEDRQVDSTLTSNETNQIICIQPAADDFQTADYSAAHSPPASSSQYLHTQEQIEVLEKVIKRIKEVHEANTPYTVEFIKALPEREKEYVRQKELNVEMFGPTKTMSRAEYLSVYEATGIDVDGRREMLEMALPHIELCIKRFICYVKAIPGFNDLTVDDQICLIKTTRFYCWMILSHRCFNHELRLHASCDGRLISAEDMTKFNDPEIVQALFDLQKRIKNLNLTDEEAVTFAAFCVMSTDHHLLERCEVAEKSQELLLNCLLHLFEKHHPEDRMRLTKFIDCLLYMKSAHDENIKAEEKFASDWAGIVEFPPVMYEIWSS